MTERDLETHIDINDKHFLSICAKMVRCEYFLKGNWTVDVYNPRVRSVEIDNDNKTAIVWGVKKT